MNNISCVGNSCFGCSACVNICPHKAITMVANQEGFLYPVVDSAKCTNCGACKKVCPHLVNNYSNSENPPCFAFYAGDSIRYASSSGGVFPVLAKYFVDNGGYVAGAIWNKDATVSHIVSNKQDDIKNMQSSKYLQSNIGYCYLDVLKILKTGSKVLFTGTPCQVAGLRSYLGKDYENLFAVDIVCHGVPSPKVFKKYVNGFIKHSDEKWINTNFRDKINGWRPELTTTTTTTTKFTTQNSSKNDDFMKAFLQNLCLRKTCANCKFQTIPRQGDLTIGDFWGIWDYDKTFDDSKGCSVVLENNAKGSILLEVLKNNAKFIKEVPIKYAVEGNPCLVRSVYPHKNRRLFFDLLEKNSLKDTVETCLSNRADFLIVNFWDSYFNYGAMLTAYAMQELVKSFGFIPKILDTGERTHEAWYKNSFMEDFANKYLDKTDEVNSLKKAKKLSKNVKGVIIGSDQVLRYEYIKGVLNKYLLKFCHHKTRKLAISASFGIAKDEYLKSLKRNMADFKMIKNSLKEFDFLSCRELSGEEIYKDLFGLDSKTIIDPVFLIPKEKYEAMAKESDVDVKGKAFSYILYENKQACNELYKHLYEKYNIETFVIDRTNDKFSTEDWLKSIQDCKLFVTDSFHGVCFAIIFNKPFICIDSVCGGSARFDSIAKIFGIEEFIYKKIEDALQKDLISPDYQKINNILESNRHSCLKLIENVLKGDFSNNKSANLYKILGVLDLWKYWHSLKHYLAYKRVKFLMKISKGKKREHYQNKYYSLKRGEI